MNEEGEEWVDIDDSGIKMEKEFAKKEGYLKEDKPVEVVKEPVKRSWKEKITGAIDRYKAGAPEREKARKERRQARIEDLQYRVKETNLRNKLQSMQSRSMSNPMASNPFVGGFGSFTSKRKSIESLPNPMTMNPWGKQAKKVLLGKPSSGFSSKKNKKSSSRTIVIKVR